MAAKKNNNNLFLWAAVALGAYLLLKKKAPAQSAAAAEAAGTARGLVADAVNRVTFVPDTTTDKQLYSEDQKACK